MHAGTIMKSQSDLQGFVTDQERVITEKRSLATLRRERQRGEGPPFVVLGGLVRYPRSGYEEWLAEKLSAAAACPKRNAHVLKVDAPAA
jgi:hypothetical protein